LIDWIKLERYNGYCPKTRKSFERIFAVPAEEMKDDGDEGGDNEMRMSASCPRDT